MWEVEVNGDKHKIWHTAAFSAAADAGKGSGLTE